MSGGFEGLIEVIMAILLEFSLLACVCVCVCVGGGAESGQDMGGG